jgi:predicted pyridoxine 5'-phosphate oxidase superfamily flavin-nucleotide-binding protein
MHIVYIPKEICEKFSNPNAVKILGTVDAEGNPNVAIVSSLFIIDRETIGFADMQLVKTKKNLDATKKAAVLVWVPPGSCYQLKGAFEGFQRSGPIYDAVSNSATLRFLTTTNPRGIGAIKVESIFLSQPPMPGHRIA